MQSKILYIISICAIIFSISACDKSPTTYKSPGYIAEYYSIAGMADESYVSTANGTLTFLFSGEIYYTGAKEYIFSKDQRYYDLCIKYGDLKPGGEICYKERWGFIDSGAVAIAEAIDELHITSSAEWDATHAAGASLDDIFEVEYVSYMPYIRNNYIGEPRTHCKKYLAEIQPGDLYLSAQIAFKTECLPTAAQQHTLTVTFVLDTGETIEYDVDVDFSSEDVQEGDTEN